MNLSCTCFNLPNCIIIYSRTFYGIFALLLLGNPNNPSLYGAGGEEQATLGTSRRADIPSEDERTVIKKQAVTYPYNYLYPGYMMSHAINPYYHYTPINYVRDTSNLFS